MKKSTYFAILFSFITLPFYSQNTVKLDTLLGDNGVFKRFKPKEIKLGQNLNFNLKISFSGTDKKGKTLNGFIFMNTKYGYVGVAQTKDFEFNTDKKFNLMVFSNSQQNFTFITDNKGRKTVMGLAFNPNRNKDKVSIKKNAAAAKTVAQSNIKSYAYSNDNLENGLLYLTDSNLSNSNNFKNLLGYAGLGLYQVDSKTVLCSAMTSINSTFEINKIEAVKIVLNTSEFKKEEMEGMNAAVIEMMKKLNDNK